MCLRSQRSGVTALFLFFVLVFMDWLCCCTLLLVHVCVGLTAPSSLPPPFCTLHAQAIACLKRALYLDPLEWIISYNLGLVHLNTGQ